MTFRPSLLVTGLLVLFITTSVDRAAAQAVALAAQVDELFAQWDKDSPGCACAVMRDGEIVYSRGYGMANLEHDVPLTPQSVFYIASTSNHFSERIASAVSAGVLTGSRRTFVTCSNA